MNQVRTCMNLFSDNKKFWITIKHFFSDKNKKSGKIILVENNEVILDNQMNAEIMNEYFINITKTLDIPEIRKKIIPVDIEYIDPIEEIIYKYSNTLVLQKLIKSQKDFRLIK